ncbi:lysozyme M1 (1,4-beta-N-acetylmuramidase) [Actinobacteria bacterium IMCC26103]|nr:lysozyme M1 (1,4-beta-N-acetylmuramidase) [Actinobacteria bacterium IMCC26103]
MKRIILIIAMSLGFFSLQTIASDAATSKITMSLRQTPGGAEPIVTLYGSLKPAKSGIKVSVQIQLDGKWQDTRFSSKTARVGTWQIVAVATALDAAVKYRAKAKIGSKNIYSNIRSINVKSVPEISDAATLAVVDQMGPGGRIHGADISRWQHPNDAPIDFVKMHQAGVRFVMIKASDTRDDADALSLKYLIMDRSAAQAAGIYTGFYHYAVLPDVSTDDQVITDAQTQAQKALWRLGALGGYNERDLPYALDLENNCVRLSGKTCARYLPKAQITLWAKTFLQAIKTKTDRTPIIYSYPSFLEGAMVRDDELRQYPLWLAQYAINPADPLAQPGLKEGGCFVHSWTTANCSSTWTVWQYTSCGIAPKYGVPGTRVDLNVFRGTPSTFLDLIKGSWIPEVADQMPKNEPTSLTYKNIKFSTADKPVNLEVDVIRPDGRPVVTGTVRFYVNSLTPISPKPVQTVVRATSGSWKLSIKGIPAGLWTGNIGFVDATGTHADSKSPIEFAIGEAAPTTPTPTPKPSAVPSKQPATDGCKNQIKN